jgi:hypothetical protein
VFKSGFAEGDAIDLRSGENGKCPAGKKTLTVIDDYDLFHNVLYYIYTDHISFSTNLSFDHSVSRKPGLCAAEDIYAIADRLLLNDLKDKALEFLFSSRTVEDITSHLFSPFALLHKPVGAKYAYMFRKNWNGVKKTMAYRQFVENMEGDMDYVRRFLEVMDDTKFPDQDSRVYYN